MVVVEHASKLIGKTVEIEFIRSLQTAAGKMMFAKPTEPVAQPVQNLSKKPKQEKIIPAKKVFTPSEPVINVPSVAPAFHSDRNDQRLASRNVTKPYQPRQKPQNVPGAPYKQTPKKPRTSAQNEDDLIRMLNNQ